MGLLRSLWDTVPVPGLLQSIRMLHPMPRKELTPHGWDNRNTSLYEGLYDLVFRKWSTHWLNIKGIKSYLHVDRPARAPHGITSVTFENHHIGFCLHFQWKFLILDLLKCGKLCGFRFCCFEYGVNRKVLNSEIPRKLENQYLEFLSRINDDHVLSVLKSIKHCYKLNVLQSSVQSLHLAEIRLLRRISR